MPLALVQTAAPSEEPVSLAEIKHHVKQDLTDDDGLLEGLGMTARVWIENYTQRQLLLAQWRLSLDRFPRFEGTAGHNTDYEFPPFWPSLVYWAYGPIRLPRPPLYSVDSITYDDIYGVSQTLDPSQYRIDMDGEPARVHPAYGLFWPAIRPQSNSVRVTYRSGSQWAAGVPRPIKLAILLLVGHWYVHREEVAEGNVQTDSIPMGVKDLVSPYVCQWEF